MDKLASYRQYIQTFLREQTIGQTIEGDIETEIIVIPINFRRLICHGSQRSEVSKVYSPQLVRWFTAIMAAYTIHLVSIWNDYIFDLVASNLL